MGRDCPHCHELNKVLHYLQWHDKMTALSNEDLVKELLKVTPVLCKLGSLIDIVVERLCPGILDKLAADEKQPNVEMFNVENVEPPNSLLSGFFEG